SGTLQDGAGPARADGDGGRPRRVHRAGVGGEDQVDPSLDLVEVRVGVTRVGLEVLPGAGLEGGDEVGEEHRAGGRRRARAPGPARPALTETVGGRAGYLSRVSGAKTRSTSPSTWSRSASRSRG